MISSRNSKPTFSPNTRARVPLSASLTFSLAKKLTMLKTAANGPKITPYKDYQNFLKNCGTLPRKQKSASEPNTNESKQFKVVHHIQLSTSDTKPTSEENKESIQSVTQRVANLQANNKQQDKSSQFQASKKIFESNGNRQTNANLSEKISKFETKKTKVVTIQNVKKAEPVKKSPIVPNNPSPPPPIEQIIPPPPQFGLKEENVTKLQATLSSHQINLTFDNPDGIDPRTLTHKDALGKKIANGALKNIYSNYHQKANHMVEAMPSEMVHKNNNISQIIQDLASQGDLEKLSGRVMPKTEE